MNPTVQQVREILSNVDGASTETLVFLQHWGVCYFRTWCAERGYVREALGAEEAQRVQGLTLDQYLTACRAGSRYRMNRKARLAVYSALYAGDELKRRGL